MLLFIKGNIAYCMGSKANNLTKLKEFNFNVPPFIVIATQELEKFLKANNIYDYQDKDICQKIIDGKFNEDLEEKILEAAYRFRRCAVRSSSDLEDGNHKSGAGQFETFLTVKPKDVIMAVKKVWISAFKQDNNSYFTKKSLMTVIIQQMIESEIAGVVFSRNPVTGNDEVILEYVYGTGERLVSGRIAPATLIFKKNQKSDNLLFQRIINEVIRAEKIFKTPVDMEFCVKEEQLYFVQVRPITAIANLPAWVLAIKEAAEQREYQFYVNRDFCWLVLSSAAEASKPERQKTKFGFSIPNNGIIINGDEYVENDDASTQVFAKMYQNEALEKFSDEIYALSTKIREVTDTLITRDFSNFNQEELKTTFIKYLEIYIDSYMPLLMRPDSFLENFLDQELKSLSEAERDKLKIDIAYLANQDTYYSLERRDFLRAVLAKNGFGQHSDKYSWLKSGLYELPGGFNEEDYYKRSQIIDNPQNELDKLIARDQESESNFVVALERIKAISSNGYHVAKLLNRFIFLRTYTTESSDRLFFYIRQKLIKPIANILNLSEQALVMLEYQEIIDLLDGQQFEMSIVDKRRKGRIIWTMNQNISSYFGSEVQMLSSLFAQKFKINDQSLKGLPASGGKVIGRARKIAFSSPDLKTGEILVASMLTPDITLGIEKAGGYVTVEGGITSHAAIIAREYNRPCVIGVKGAMQINNGDLIEVDGDLGIIKIIEREEH